MVLSDAAFRKERNYAAVRRRHPDSAVLAANRESTEKLSDWKGVCQYCKQKLTGTVAELMAHSCKEYEATLG